MSTVIFGDTTPQYDPTILQSYSDTCAIKCQQLILDRFGKDISEDALRNEAGAMGWYVPGGGTPMEDVGKLLELHNVPVTSFENANQYTLMHELAQGHQVIVALDSGEMWSPGIFERLMDFLGLSGADHALIVSGIDATDPNNIMVTVTDPGSGHITQYPYDQFANAWEDSHFSMVATNEAPMDSSIFAGMDGMLNTIMGLPSVDWMKQFGSLIADGIELTDQVIDYMQQNPELVQTALSFGTLFLAESPLVHTDGFDSYVEQNNFNSFVTPI